jgi:hypothetical protein
MTSYFDILPKELFIIILEKLEHNIYDGIFIVYPRYVGLFTDANFWRGMCKDMYGIDIRLSNDAHYWQEVYAILCNDGSWLLKYKILTKGASPDDILSLYKIKRDYPQYYEICKDINLYVSGIFDAKYISWYIICDILKIYGNLSYPEFIKKSRNLDYRGIYTGIIFDYIEMCIKKLLDKDYIGDLNVLVSIATYNYDMYNNIMKILSPSKKVLEEL